MQREHEVLLDGQMREFPVCLKPYDDALSVRATDVASPCGPLSNGRQLVENRRKHGLAGLLLQTLLNALGRALPTLVELGSTLQDRSHAPSDGGSRRAVMYESHAATSKRGYDASIRSRSLRGALSGPAG